MYYDRSQLLSHNRLFNFVIGNRGGGKTFNFKEWAISDFKKKGKKFIWVRRNIVELEGKMTGQFFDDIRQLFPNDVLEVKGKKLYCNKEEMGEFIPLSIQHKYKSIPFPNVNKIIFDEFIIDKSASNRYLKNEVEMFLELYETISRLRDDVRAVFVGNAISIVNPYFLFWKLKPNLKKRFSVNEHIAVEFYTNEEFIKKKKQTKFGKLLEGTSYGSYAIENQFLRDNDTFIERKSPTAQFSFGVKYNSVMYGFWVDYKQGYLYVNRQYDPSSYSLYAITKDDHEPNLLLIRSLARNKPVERMVFCFENGLVRFEDMQVKNQFFEFIHYFIR